MKFNLSTILAILSIVFCISTFVLNRRDKALQDKESQDKESGNQILIDYRLTKVEEKLDKILNKLEDYDKEIDEKINNAINLHIKLYHKGEK